MLTPRGLLHALKHNLARWERIGEWDESGWHLREHSDGLADWISRQERRDSDVWSLAVRQGRRTTIHGGRFDYRLVPQGDGLTLERRPH